MNIYVGNLPFDTDESSVRSVFGEYGEVADVKIIVDHETGRSRGFAFVTMNDDTEANAAIEGLNGADFGGRPLKINEARPREERPRQGFGGGGSRGGGGFKRGGDRPRRSFNEGGGGGGRDRRDFRGGRRDDY